MSETKFTPGPYRATFDEAVKVADASGSLAMMMQTHLHGRRDASEVEATAHLLAAAPDLYEALLPFAALFEKRDQRYRARGGDMSVFPDTHPMGEIEAAELPVGVWRAVRAALSKARGEAK